MLGAALARQCSVRSLCGGGGGVGGGGGGVRSGQVPSVAVVRGAAGPPSLVALGILGYWRGCWRTGLRPRLQD